jgi:hypothetical protein
VSNPYQSPQSYGQPSYQPGYPGGEDREKTRSVARYQRLVMYALLANIGLNILSFALQGSMRGPGGLLISLAVLVGGLGVIGFSMTAMFLLANTLHNPIIGAICAFLVLIPCVALITLLVINQQASTYLTARGVKVGFMGADPNSI